MEGTSVIRLRETLFLLPWSLPLSSHMGPNIWGQDILTSPLESSKGGTDMPPVTRWVPDRQVKPLRVAGTWGCFPPQRQNFPC